MTNRRPIVQLSAAAALIATGGLLCSSTSFADPGAQDHPQSSEHPSSQDHPRGDDHPSGQDHPRGGDHPGGQDHPRGDDHPSRGDLPKAEALLEKMYEYMGGEKALDDIDSAHFDILLATQMVDITIDVKWAAINEKDEENGDENENNKSAWDSYRMLVDQQVMGMNMKMGTDGEVAWAYDPQGGGYRIARKTELDSARGTALMPINLITLEDRAESVTTVARENFNDRDAYKVQFTPKAEEGGGAPSFLFIDEEKNTPLGIYTEQESRVGTQSLTITFDDWKAVGDVQMFHKMEFKQGQGEPMLFSYRKIDFNDVDESVFELPDEVKELAKNGARRPNRPTTPPPPPTRPGSGGSGGGR